MSKQYPGSASRCSDSSVCDSLLQHWNSRIDQKSLFNSRQWYPDVVVTFKPIMKPLICLSVLIAATACGPTQKSPDAQRAEQIEARESAKRAYVWFHRQMVNS